MAKELLILKMEHYIKEHLNMEMQMEQVFMYMLMVLFTKEDFKTHGFMDMELYAIKKIK